MNDAEDLNLQQILSNLKLKRYFILKVVCIALVVGVVAALFVRKQYSASCLVFPQVSDGVEIGGTLGGLAAMAGVDLASSGNGSIPIELYQNIFNYHSLTSNVYLSLQNLQSSMQMSSSWR